MSSGYLMLLILFPTFIFDQFLVALNMFTSLWDQVRWQYTHVRYLLVFGYSYFCSFISAHILNNSHVFLAMSIKLHFPLPSIIGSKLCLFYYLSILYSFLMLSAELQSRDGLLVSSFTHPTPVLSSLIPWSHLTDNPA